MKIFLRLLGVLFSLFTLFTAEAQVVIGGDDRIDLRAPQTYEIAGITVTGARNFDTEAIILFTGLKVGDVIEVPGEDLAEAVKKLWRQQLFSDIRIRVGDIRENKVFLNIDLEERERLSRFKFEGVKKSEAETIRERIRLRLGTIVNDNLIQNTKNIIRKFYVSKGFLEVTVDIEQKPDTLVKESVILIIKVNKGDKVRVRSIEILGNEEQEGVAEENAGKFLGIFRKQNSLSDAKLRGAMKDTKVKKWWKIFTGGKFIEDDYRADKMAIIDKYNAKGFRNAKILSDTVMFDPKNNRIDIRIKVEEGDRFYFRDIRWVGNTKFDSDYLSKVLGIKKGDVYSRQLLEERLLMSQNNTDVSSLYLDDGYLSFSANPVEVGVENDSIDFEIRIYEGKQFRVNRIILTGNTKTNDRVVRREIRTRPGDLFSRADIIRTQRELAGLNYFNPEKFGINPIQNPAEGTVDIEYAVEEKPSDQIELSGGWGAGRVVGTLGLSLTNFSIKNAFRKGGWKPIPSGDGQRLSLRAQSNGAFFQAYSLSFTEPWLGGKKPNSLSLSFSHSVQTNGQTKFIEVDGEKIRNPDRAHLKISGVSVGLGKQLHIPDDYFSLYQSVSYQHYDLNNFGSIFTFANGFSNNISYTLALSRNSISQPIYPRFGSEIKFVMKATPPYSLFSGRDYSGLSDQEKFRFVEYHKWKFTTTWHTELAKNLVLYSKVGMGFLGKYNGDIGPSPFERFYLGGSALTGFNLDGREIIGLRGYDDMSLSPSEGALMISKYTTELRYPLSLNPNATIYVLGFLEAGNTWNAFEDYAPFTVKRSGGVGVRLFLPMFGLMGLDYGWRFDDVNRNPNMSRGQFHFTIGMNLGEL